MVKVPVCISRVVLFLPLLCSGSWKVRRVCHGDAGLHGGQAVPDPCRILRRGQRHFGWGRRRDAQQRECHGKAAWALTGSGGVGWILLALPVNGNRFLAALQVPGRDGEHHEEDRRRGRACTRVREGLGMSSRSQPSPSPRFEKPSCEALLHL